MPLTTEGAPECALPLAIGTPRPQPNDRLRQVSWLPDRRFPLAFPSPRNTWSQWQMSRSLPGHSCGGSMGLEPISLLGPLPIALEAANP